MNKFLPRSLPFEWFDCKTAFWDLSSFIGPRPNPDWYIKTRIWDEKLQAYLNSGYWLFPDGTKYE